MDLKDYEKALNNCTHLSVIFQLTDKCVLKCKYCFARGAHKGVDKISPELLEKVISQAFLTRHPNVTFEWTGGEALLMGLDFFKEVVALQKKFASKPFCNCLQTSGYLFDKELIDYLIDNGFSISLTIDGPKEVHNGNRPTQSGADSFDRVLKTREYIAKRVGECGFISTVTRNNLGHEKETLTFFRELGIHSFHSNPYIFFDKNVVKDQSLAIDNNDYARYFISQFNSWYDSGKLEPIPLTVNYFISCLSAKKPSNYTLCTFGGRCLTNFIAVTPSGDCYNCPKFSGHSNMLLGNLYEKTIPQLLDPDSNPMMKNLISQRVQSIQRCKDSKCRFEFICNSGCPYLSYISSNGENISDRDYLCEGKTQVFEYLESIRNVIIEDTIK